MRDYIMLNDLESVAVDTAEEIAVAEKLLAERGIASAPVWRGEPPDTVKTDLVVFAAR